MKQNLFTCLVCIAATLLLPAISFAQINYYVAANGSDANAGTSLAAAYATIAKAVSKATTPGDTIFVRSGTYTVTNTVSITRAGTAAKRIVLTVYMPDMVNANSRPVFDFSGQSVSSNSRGFNLSNANYWVIYGIIIKGAGDNGMYVGGTSHTRIEFCDFTRSRDSGFQIGGSSHNDTIINCDAYANADLGPGTTTMGGNADGFDPKLDPGDTILFRGCRAWLNSDDGFDGYMRPSGTGGDTDNITSFLEDCWAFHNGYYWLDGSTNSQMNGNGFKLGGSDNKDQAHNFVVVKCLAFDNKVQGFDQNSNAGSIYLYNCTAFHNLGDDYYMTSPTTVYEPGARLVIENCISLGTAGVSLPTASTATRAFITATNSFKTNTTSPEILSFDTTGVTGMRGLDGSLPVLKYARLDSTAPKPYTYIDKGTVLTNVMYHDTLGIPYTGAAPDLGCYELVLDTTGAPDTSNAVPIYTSTAGIEATVFPDPFTNIVTIHYSLLADALVTISIIDVQGRIMNKTIQQKQQAGVHENVINAQALPVGVYYLRLSAGDKVVYREMVKR